MIEGDGYKVYLDDETGAVVLSGTLRLGGMAEYAPIMDFLTEALDRNGNRLSVNMRDLQLLNSSGITMLSKFVIACRTKKAELTMQVSSNIPWQEKSLKNLQRLLPSLALESQ